MQEQIVGYMENFLSPEKFKYTASIVNFNSKLEKIP